MPYSITFYPTTVKQFGFMSADRSNVPPPDESLLLRFTSPITAMPVYSPYGYKSFNGTDGSSIFYQGLPYMRVSISAIGITTLQNGTTAAIQDNTVVLAMNSFYAEYWRAMAKASGLMWFSAWWPELNDFKIFTGIPKFPEYSGKAKGLMFSQFDIEINGLGISLNPLDYNGGNYNPDPTNVGDNLA